MDNEETFTDFMVRCMTGEEDVSQAMVIIRRGDQTVGYKFHGQEVADTLGLMRLACLSVEHDLVSGWRDQR